MAHIIVKNSKNAWFVSCVGCCTMLSPQQFQEATSRKSKEQVTSLSKVQETHLTL